MLKDQYLHSIINNLGIAINRENNSEIIVKLNIIFNKKNNCYMLSEDYDIFYQDYGTLIVDFQNTDFTNRNEFINFYSKYCLFGLENKKLFKLFSNNSCTSIEYNNFIDKTFNKYKKIMISFQEDINNILNYCLFHPSKKTLSLSPFERLCILEYTANNPAILQENIMQTIYLNTLSNIKETNLSQEELINKLVDKTCSAYSNSLNIPNDISSLIHFELTEILKDNIILRKCNYCNKYFIAPNRHITYCSNIAPGYSTKTCKQVARNNKYLDSKKSDEALALFTKVYNNKANKARRYKDIIDYSLDYKHFQQIGKKKVEKYKKHEISKDDFISWINRNK